LREWRSSWNPHCCQPSRRGKRYHVLR